MTDPRTVEDLAREDKAKVLVELAHVRALLEALKLGLVAGEKKSQAQRLGEGLMVAVVSVRQLKPLIRDLRYGAHNGAVAARFPSLRGIENRVVDFATQFPLNNLFEEERAEWALMHLALTLMEGGHG